MVIGQTLNYISTCLSRHVFFHDTSMLVAIKLLSRQIFIATSLLLSRQIFIATSLLLSRQTHFCRDKTCRNKGMLVATNTCLSRQKYFVVTSILLSRQKTYLCKTCVCHDKHVFVATKMKLVAAPANDKQHSASYI